MYLLKEHRYFVYIITNHSKTVLYIGVTNNLEARLAEHFFNRGKPTTFAGRYYCYHLLYFEEFSYINNAIAREKELKNWSRMKKERLIKKQNPLVVFMNGSFCRHWPPRERPGRF